MFSKIKTNKKLIWLIAIFWVQTFLSITFFRVFRIKELIFVLVILLTVTYFFLFKKYNFKVKLIAFSPIVLLYIFAFSISPYAWYNWLTELLLISFTLFALYQFPKVIPVVLSVFLAASSIFCFYYYVDVIYPKNHPASQFHKSMDEVINASELINLKVEGANEKHFYLESLIKNKIALVDFSFLECVPCRQKEPSLDSLTKYYATDTNVVILRIVDGRISSKENFLKYNKETNLHFNEYYDSAGTVSSFFLKENSYPTDFLIYKGKYIVSTSNGFGGNKNYSTEYIKIIQQEIKILLNAKK